VSFAERARVRAWHLREQAAAGGRHVQQRWSGEHLYLDALASPRRAILVIGSIRSGTTKLAEALASARSTRLVFEPLNPAESPYAPSGFRGGCYLRPDASDATLFGTWTRVLKGRVRSDWTDSRNRSRVATRRVVKCVAANNLVGWLRCHFPRTPIVFVYRHPLAVAASVVDLDAHADRRGAARPFEWRHVETDRMLADVELIEGPLAAVRPTITRTFAVPRSAVVDHTVRWCLENYVPLTLPPDPGFLAVRFEDLVAHPEHELRRIGDFAALDVERGLREFDEPSSTDWLTEVGDRIASRDDRRDGWLSRVGDADRDGALEVVAAFGLDRFLATTEV
jgi:hypothetical protein